MSVDELRTAVDGVGATLCAMEHRMARVETHTQRSAQGRRERETQRERERDS